MRSHRSPVWSIDQLTPPQVEPITLELARLDRRLDADGSPPSHPDDALLLKLITRARVHVENYTSRSIAPQRWRLKLNQFPSDEEPIVLPRLPIIEIESFKVGGSDFTAYAASCDEWHAELHPSAGCWPAITPSIGAIEIIYRAGYVDGSPEALAVPETLQGAMYLLLGHWYENREAVITGTITASLPDGWETLLAPYIRSAL